MEKMDFLGGVWVFTWRTEGPQAYVPIERTHGIYTGNILFYFSDPLIARLFAFRCLGGILGWDPVLTTCILGRSLERTIGHHTRHNTETTESIMRRIAKQSIGSITPHTFSHKISHNNFKNILF